MKGRVLSLYTTFVWIRDDTGIQSVILKMGKDCCIHCCELAEV